MIAPSMSHVFREPPGSKKQDPLKTIFFNFLLFTKNIFRDLCCCCCWKETLIETPHLPKNAQIFCLELEYLTRLLTLSRSLCLSDCELCDVIVGYLLSLSSLSMIEFAAYDIFPYVSSFLSVIVMFSCPHFSSLPTYV